MSGTSTYANLNLTDHKDIESLCKRLALATAKSPLDIDRIIEELVELRSGIMAHFDEEEKYMNDICYPNAQYHKTSHDHIVAELSETIESMARGSEKRMQDLWRYFLSRLDAHMNKFDGDLLAFLSGPPTIL